LEEVFSPPRRDGLNRSVVAAQVVPTELGQLGGHVTIATVMALDQGKSHIHQMNGLARGMNCHDPVPSVRALRVDGTRRLA